MPLITGTILGPSRRRDRRFLMLRDNGQEAAGNSIYLVMNWFDELLSRLPPT